MGHHRKRERDRGRDDAVFYEKEDKSLIDVDFFKLCTGERCWLPSELMNTIEQFIVYVHRNNAHFTPRCCLFWLARA